MKKYNIGNFLYLVLLFLTTFFVFISNKDYAFGNILFSIILLTIMLIIILLNGIKIIYKLKKSLAYFIIMTFFLLLSILKTDGGFGSICLILIMSLLLIITGTIEVDYKCILITFLLSFVLFSYQLVSDYSSINRTDASSQTLIIYFLMITTLNIIYRNCFFKNNKFILLIINLGFMYLAIQNSLKYHCYTTIDN